MKVAVVGLGMAGSTLACLLADRRLDVTVGAGIWLQHMGQQVLDRLGLLAPLRAQSRVVSRADIRNSSGRQLVDASYADGSRSRVRQSMNVAVRDHPYDYGALWTIVEDPDELCADELYQCLRGTRHWREAARPLAGPMAPLLDRVDHRPCPPRWSCTPARGRRTCAGTNGGPG